MCSRLGFQRLRGWGRLQCCSAAASWRSEKEKHGDLQAPVFNVEISLTQVGSAQQKHNDTALTTSYLTYFREGILAFRCATRGYWMHLIDGGNPYYYIYIITHQNSDDDPSTILNRTLSILATSDSSCC